jgi:hypothetical protein
VLASDYDTCVSVDELRAQLRDRGYLTHGIERWFALDPWSSRAFWVELTIVALKAATVIALFGALPLVAVMLVRNHPLTALETLQLALLYFAAGIGVAFAFIIAVALVLKLRPEIAIDTPRTLLAISIAAAILLTLPIAVWWDRFDTPPSLLELAIGLAFVLVFFLIATIIVSAALLSFSIYELQRVPAIHRKPRTVPMTIAATLLMALLFLPAYAAQEKRATAPPIQVLTIPTQRRIALVAVDGLTFEILHSSKIQRAAESAAPRVSGESTTERWASVGTGVPTSLHGVRAVDGIRLARGSHLIQSVSRDDVVLRHTAAREPLPPTVRRRDYVWEIFAARGVPSVAVNWWTTESGHFGVLDSIGQETIFSAARGDAEKVDVTATRRFFDAIDRDHPQFATVYLPALDVVLNRLPLDASSRMIASVRILDVVASTIRELNKRGFDVVIVGLPGDHQSGRAVVAATFLLPNDAAPFDVAPTLCAALGFPPSNEMPGRALATKPEPRIATYGPRSATSLTTKVDQEYYENLKSLGYIK